MIRTVVFDLGGVMFNPNWKRIHELIDSRFGVSISLCPELGRLYRRRVATGKLALRDFLRLVLSKKLPKTKIDALIESYRNAYRKYAPVDLRMTVLVRRLRRRLKVYAMSNTNDVHKSINKDRGLFSIFDDVFLSCDTGFVKPNLKFYQHLLTQINCGPNNVVLIDDRKANLDAARSIGFRVIRFQNYENLLIQLRRLRLYP